jgi:hypothetical protein
MTNEHPGRALYRKWHNIIKLACDGSIYAYSAASHTVDLRGYPGRGSAYSIMLPSTRTKDVLLSFADDPRWRGKVVITMWVKWHPVFALRWDGSFKLMPPAKKNLPYIEKETFLGFGEDASRRQWYVYPDHNMSSWNIGEPEPYVENECFSSGRWWTLEPSDTAASGWKIIPRYLKRREVLHNNTDVYHWQRYQSIDIHYQRVSFDFHTGRRDRRFARRERWRNGTTRPPRPRTPVLNHQGERVDTETAAHLVAAAFDISLPARSTPLKRRKEAHGNHVDGTSADRRPTLAPH